MMRRIVVLMVFHRKYIGADRRGSYAYAGGDLKASAGGALRL